MCADEAKPLDQQVKTWFESEGYPLEFRVARAFEEHGFNPHQGHYVVDPNEDQAREIDVVADMDFTGGDTRIFRVSHMIECKWSRDKPWVIFTSRRSIMAESACIAQTVGSLLGEAVMFCLAGEQGLYPLEIFKRPDRGGFSGRRAFEKQDKDRYDQVYRTIQGVVNAAVAETKRYDLKDRRQHEVPRDGAVAFPVVVVDGSLFEAYYDPHGDEVKVSEVDRLRLFWRGSKVNRRSITPIDVVTARIISDYARVRASEINSLLTGATLALERIHTAFKERKFEKLQIKPAARGFTGLPPLLRELLLLEQAGPLAPRLGP